MRRIAFAVFILVLGCGRIAAEHAPMNGAIDQATGMPVHTSDAATSELPPRAPCGRRYPLTTTIRPAAVMLVIDASDALSVDVEPPSPQRPWVAVQDAIRSFVVHLRTPAFADVAVGAIVMGDSLDASGSGPTYPSAADVPPAPVDDAQAQRLVMRVSGTPGGAAPVHAALQGAYAALRAYAPDAKSAPGSRAVVLVSGRTPRSNLDPMIEMARIPDLVFDAATAGIATDVVGIGRLPALDPSFYDASFLDRVARDGMVPRELMSACPSCYTQLGVAPTTATELAQGIAQALFAGVYRARGACTLALSADAPDINGLSLRWTPSGEPPRDLEWWRNDITSISTTARTFELLRTACVEAVDYRGSFEAEVSCVETP